MTNNHVLDSVETAAASRAEFDYETGDDGRLRPAVWFGLDPDAFFVTDPGLDYTFVAVDVASTDGRLLHRYAWIPLIEEQGKVIKGEYVNIFQHPNGEPKQVALRENQIVDLMENFLHYKTDTAPGSSGAPVFNDEWELVALHHSGVPDRDRDGNILAIDGGLWSEEMGEHRVKWVANEGARVSRIVRHLRGQVLDPAQRRLSADVLKGQPPPSATGVPNGYREPERAGEGPGLAAARQPGGIDDVVAGDIVTWTVPLQVNVRLGTPVLSVPPAPTPAVRTPAADTIAPAADGGMENPELDRILAELERNRRRPYCDEAANEADRDAYYTGLPKRRTGAAFFTALSELLRRTHDPQLRYAPSRHVYPWVDLQLPTTSDTATRRSSACRATATRSSISRPGPGTSRSRPDQGVPDPDAPSDGSGRCHAGRRGPAEGRADLGCEQVERVECLVLRWGAGRELADEVGHLFQ